MARRLLLRIALVLYRLLESRLESFRSGSVAARWPDLRSLIGDLCTLWETLT